MNNDIDFNKTYTLSDDIVVREIQGELIIVPLTSGIGNIDDELYTLNETGRAIWEKLDGTKTLAEIVTDLSVEFKSASGEIKKDVQGLIEELFSRKIVVTVPGCRERDSG